MCLICSSLTGGSGVAVRSVMAGAPRADLLAASVVPDELAMLADREIAATGAAEGRAVVFRLNSVGLSARARHGRDAAAFLVNVVDAERLDVALGAVLRAE